MTHLEYLLRRLHPTHLVKKEIEEHLSGHIAGLQGEKSLDFHLDYLKGPHLILNDLRLYDGTHFFQMDTLILFPQYILIIEAKNLKGQIKIDRKAKQLIREFDGVVEGFQDRTSRAPRKIA